MFILVFVILCVLVVLSIPVAVTLVGYLWKDARSFSINDGSTETSFNFMRFCFVHFVVINVRSF
jgi:hypothetical protein